MGRVLLEGAAVAVVLEERGSFLLLTTAGTAGLVWGTIFVAEPGGGLAVVDLGAGKAVGIFEFPGGEGA